MIRCCAGTQSSHSHGAEWTTAESSCWVSCPSTSTASSVTAALLCSPLLSSPDHFTIRKLKEPVLLLCRLWVPGKYLSLRLYSVSFTAFNTSIQHVWDLQLLTPVSNMLSRICQVRVILSVSYLEQHIHSEHVSEICFCAPPCNAPKLIVMRVVQCD